MTTHASKPGILTDARGIPIGMEPGPCIYCGLHVESDRETAGAQLPYDPAWSHEGDFGCDQSPESNDDGCGDHARPYDLARLQAESSRLRAALERCHKMILEDFTSEVRKAIPNWYEVEKAARAALKGGE